MTAGRRHHEERSIARDLDQEERNLLKLKGPALLERYRQAVGSDTKSTNRAYLVRRILQTMNEGAPSVPPAGKKHAQRSASRHPRRDPRLPAVGTRSELIGELNRYLAREIEFASVVRLDERTMRMGTTSLAHDVRLLAEVAASMRAHLTAHPFHSDGEFARWLIERHDALHALNLELYRAGVSGGAAVAKIYRELDIIFEIWKSRYRAIYWDVTQDLVESLQCVVKDMSARSTN